MALDVGEDVMECRCEFEGECMGFLPVPGDLTPADVALVQSRTALDWGHGVLPKASSRARHRCLAAPSKAPA